MSYSNDLTQIRAGLVNYIGACVAASPFEGKAARHSVVSILQEESLKLSQEEAGGVFDLYVLKPQLRATKLVVQQRIEELKKIQSSKEVTAKINDYEQLVKQLDALIELIHT